MERAVEFDNQGQSLVGILHQPDHEPAERRAVILLHGWAGYRVGPHRIFVKLARGLAERGWYSLRFDFRGRGDSQGDLEQANLASMVSDAGRAVEWLASEIKPAHICLLGICSGALVAMGAPLTHPHLDRLVLWSPPSPREQRPATDSARRRLYLLKTYAAKLLDGATWRKIITLQIRPKTIGKVLLGEGPQGPDDARTEAICLKRLRQFRGRALFIYGSGEPDSKPSLEAYRALCQEMNIHHQFHLIEGSDHSFYSAPWEEEAIATTIDWLDGSTALTIKDAR